MVKRSPSSGSKTCEVRTCAPEAVEGQHRHRPMAVGAVGEGDAVGEVRRVVSRGEDEDVQVLMWECAHVRIGRFGSCLVQLLG